MYEKRIKNGKSTLYMKFVPFFLIRSAKTDIPVNENHFTYGAEASKTILYKFSVDELFSFLLEQIFSVICVISVPCVVI